MNRRFIMQHKMTTGRDNMKELKVPTRRGVLLDGVLFQSDAGEISQSKKRADTVLIAITGIHGNFYSNPFYFNIGDTLNDAGIDFIYAQTNDAYGEIETQNIKTGQTEIIGSYNERFSYTDEDIEAYLDYVQEAGYQHIILAGHSLGANKVMYYLSRHHDERVDHFLLLSPANLTHMMSGVSEQEKQIIRYMVESGNGDKMLPFYFMGWVACIADTAWDWQFSGLLNNAHVEADGDFSQAEKITHNGALLIGTYDNFTNGDPAGFLKNINDHMPGASRNKMIFYRKNRSYLSTERAGNSGCHQTADQGLVFLII